MAEKLEAAGRALVDAWCRTQNLPPIEFAPDELNALVSAVLTATPDRSNDALAEENRRLREALERIAKRPEWKAKPVLEDWQDLAADRRILAERALKGDGL